MSHTPDKPAVQSHDHAHDDAPVDVRERGAIRDGVAQVLDRRLFMQLQVFACAGDVSATIRSLGAALQRWGSPSVIYEDVNHARGLGVLTWSEDPAHFVRTVRPVLAHETLTVRPEFSMLGRAYSTGYEQDLAFWLLERPRKTALLETCPWAVWYPLKRIGAFNRLDGREQGAILREHGTIGRRYGDQDLAHDIRLACHGLDANDNDFIIGLIGKDLHPLSHVVQAMRKTRQTSEFMEHMGPFFVGHVAWRNA
jgi:chlorite dismutase